MAYADSSDISLNLPDVWITSNKTRWADFKFGDKPAARTLVAVGCSIEAPVELFKRFEMESWKAKPRCSDCRLLPDLQCQSANGKEIGGWTEVQIQVDAAGDFGTFLPIEPPAAFRINGQVNVNAVVSDPACDLRRHGFPSRFADNSIVQTASLLIVGEDGGSGQMPASLLEKQSSGLVSRLVQSPPENWLQLLNPLNVF
jgi:hypothetical protein